MTGLDVADRFVLDLHRLGDITQAAVIHGLRSADARLYAAAAGWPDRAAVACAAADIESREDTAVPRRREPIPIEPEVAEATGQQPVRIVVGDPDAMAGHGLDTATAADVDDVLAVAAVLEQTSGRRAQLRLPLSRLVDIDGTETTIVEAVVDVEVIPEAVVEMLERPRGPHRHPCPVNFWVDRRVTAEGADAVRVLAELVQSGGAS